MGFTEYMKESKQVSRFMLARIFVIGMFAGACLAVTFMFITATI